MALAMIHKQRNLAVNNMGKAKQKRECIMAVVGILNHQRNILRNFCECPKNRSYGGGNYFIDYLPPSKSFICWDKRCDDAIINNFADCEFAWCSENLGVARMFRYLWAGMLQGNMKNKEERFHPTQKPIALYKWILNTYAHEGDKILDTHVGSASSLIACEDMGYKYVGFEIDQEYYAKGVERIKTHKAQVSIMELMNDWRLP